MAAKWDKYLVYFLLLVFFIASIVVILKTQNSYGGGDHFAHFKLAYWGWKYPDMLFSHWGKPVFTILISPFAQFGINGARLYNVIAGILTAFFCWKTAKLLKFHNSWFVLFLVLFTPIYFVLMFTSLTEVTFSFFLVMAIFLFFNKKYIWSAIVLGFLPMIRTEGIIIIPLFIAAWSFKRKFLVIPFLCTGFFIVSLFGWPYYDSFWWLVTEMPYTGSAKDIYGSGRLFHFLEYNHKILGSVIGILFLVGIVITFYKWVKNDRFKVDDRFYFMMLVTGSFVVFFAAHSVAWWKGLGNSLGLIRVIGSVTPLAALTAMAGISALFENRNKRLNQILTAALLIVIAYIVFTGTKSHQYGFRISRPQKILSEAVDYIQHNKLNVHKIYYFSSYIAFKLNLDPRDNQKGQQNLPRNKDFLNTVPDSSIIIWDAHFGPNEGRMPIERLMEKDELHVLKIFKPEQNFKVLGGHDYQVVIFQKDISQKPKIRQVFKDFESGYKNTIDESIKGKKSIILEKSDTYLTLLDVVYQEISDTISSTGFNISMAYNYAPETKLKDLLLVCTLESPDDVISFKTKDLWAGYNKSNIWIDSTFYFNVPEPNSLNNRIKIYLWNKGSTEIYLDDVVISIITNIQD